MPMPAAAAFAQEWINAWNSRDIDSLLVHYSDDIEFRSLLVEKITGEPSGTITGKPNLRQYLQQALAAFPGELCVELRGAYQGVGSIVVLFEVRGRMGAEFMEFNQDGLVHRARAHAHV